MELPQYISVKKITELFDVSAKTVRNLKDVKTTTAGAASNSKKMYSSEAIIQKFGKPAFKPIMKRAKVIYCKGESEEKVKEDVLILKKQYPDHKAYYDVCENDKVTRKSFRKLIKSINAGNVGQLVVLRKSSLSISQIDLLECVLVDHGVSLIEAEKGTEDPENHAMEILSSFYETLKFTFKRSDTQNNKRQKTKQESDNDIVADEGDEFNDPVMPF